MITISAIAFHFQTKGGDWKQERNRLETELERIGEDNQRLKVSLGELPFGANGGWGGSHLWRVYGVWDIFDDPTKFLRR